MMFVGMLLYQCGYICFVVAWPPRQVTRSIDCVCYDLHPRWTCDRQDTDNTYIKVGTTNGQLLLTTFSLNLY